MVCFALGGRLLAHHAFVEALQPKIRGLFDVGDVFGQVLFGRQLPGFPLPLLREAELRNIRNRLVVELFPDGATLFLLRLRVLVAGRLTGVAVGRRGQGQQEDNSAWDQHPGSCGPREMPNHREGEAWAACVGPAES